MITLSRDNLSFTFPQVARRVQQLVEQKIQEIASELPPTWDRAALWADIQASRYFCRLTPEAQGNAHNAVHTWTPEHVEAALRKVVIDRGGLNTDAFTELTIRFQRTTRLPNDGNAYSLPMGFGQIPLCSIDDFSAAAPVDWIAGGGVIMPLARSEAISIWFSSRYRFAFKIAIGPANYLTGGAWSCDLGRQPQDYLVVPGAPWTASDDVVRHYVSLPLDACLAGDANRRRIILQVVPISAAQYFRDEGGFFLRDIKEFFMRLVFASTVSAEIRDSARLSEEWQDKHAEDEEPPARIAAHDEVVADPYPLSAWNQSDGVRCCLQPCDMSRWRQVTGRKPPYPPLVAKDYQETGIPWIDQYRDTSTQNGTLSSEGELPCCSSPSRTAVTIREFVEVQ